MYLRLLCTEKLIYGKLGSVQPTGLNMIFSMKQSELDISHSIEGYYKKLPNIIEILLFWKAHNFQAIKGIYLKF